MTIPNIIIMLAATTQSDILIRVSNTSAQVLSKFSFHFFLRQVSYFHNIRKHNLNRTLRRVCLCSISSVSSIPLNLRYLLANGIFANIAIQDFIRLVVRVNSISFSSQTLFCPFCTCSSFVGITIHGRS